MIPSIHPSVERVQGEKKFKNCRWTCHSRLARPCRNGIVLVVYRLMDGSIDSGLAGSYAVLFRAVLQPPNQHHLAAIQSILLARTARLCFACRQNFRLSTKYRQCQYANCLFILLSSPTNQELKIQSAHFYCSYNAKNRLLKIWLHLNRSSSSTPLPNHYV